MNINNNTYEETDNKFSFFNNNKTNNSLGLDSINQLDFEYLNSNAFDNLFPNKDNNMLKTPIIDLSTSNPIPVMLPNPNLNPSLNPKAKTRPKLKKPFIVKHDTININTTETTNDKCTVNPIPLKRPKGRPKSIREDIDEAEKLRIKAMFSREWRKKNKELQRQLIEEVEDLRIKKESLEQTTKDNTILKACLIKTLPAQFGDIKDSLYGEEKTNKEILDKINQYNRNNCYLKSMNNNRSINNDNDTNMIIDMDMGINVNLDIGIEKTENLKALYLQKVSNLIKGYETFNSIRTSFNH